MAIKLSAWRWQDTFARPPPQNNSMRPFREGTAGAVGENGWSLRHLFHKTNYTSTRRAEIGRRADSGDRWAQARAGSIPVAATILGLDADTKMRYS